LREGSHSAAPAPSPAVSHAPIPLLEDLTLDLARGSLLRAGAPVHLRPQSYGVLEYLVGHRGRLVSKDELLETVWQGRAVTDGSLVKCIEEVREALGPQGRHYLRNVRGRGYIFDEPAGFPAAERDEDDESPRLGAPGGEPSLGIERRRWQWLPWTMAALALAVAAVISVRTIGDRAPAITSVAVLPFTNVSGNPDLEYLCDGISESLINALSRLPRLKVIARHSSFEYKGREAEADTEEVARALGVQAILMGRVTQQDDDLLVSVELVDTRDRSQLWGDQYMRPAADLQAVQQEMARTISEKLRLRLDGAQQQQLGKPATESSQAYQFYLNGLYHLRKGGSENAGKALDYFREAVRLDPDFAPAWVGVANAESYFAGNSLLDPKGPIFNAKVAVERALALDDTLAEARVVLGNIKRNEWDWVGAEGEYRRALEVNPNLVEAHLWYSSFLSGMGRHREALVEIELAEELDPLSVGLKRREVFALSKARRFDEAVALHQSLGVEPESAGQHQSVGNLYVTVGDYERAIDEFRESISLDPHMTNSWCYLGHALAQSGQREEALRVLDHLETTRDYVSPAELAVLYVGLGDPDRAIAALERSFAAHDLQMQYLNVEWRLEPLRSDPRFQDLLRRVGLS
jgi:TolB-like protein/DNA-binding winged helix-turn-helix (wHTH) protein/Tfp pilus assembly protein PilF